MENINPQDIADGYFIQYISFLGLDDLPEDEYSSLGSLRPTQRDVGPLTVSDLVKEYSVSIEVAEKLIAYQSNLLDSYKSTVSEFLSKAGRYNEVKPYLNTRGVNKDIFLQYLASNESYARLTHEFNPTRQLGYGLIGVAISYAIFVGAVTIGWSQNPPKEVWDFIFLGLIAFTWLGLTTMAARGLPSSYRTRKIIYRILEKKK